MFYFLNCTLESFPVLQSLGISIILQASMTVFILPCFGVFSDVYNFRMLEPNFFCTFSKDLNNVFETIFVAYVIHINIFDGFD